MFTLQSQWDRPNKLSHQTSEHILRLRMIPKPEASYRTLPLRMAIATAVILYEARRQLSYSRVD